MKSGNDLVLRVNKSNQNKVTLKDFFKGGANIVETIRFETGGSLNAKQIFELFKVPMTNPESPYARTVNGTERDDMNLTGTADNDLVHGLAGNDTLNGLTGNDHLVGGTGNDTYVFNSGFGQDTIDNTGGGFDRILFDGIDFNQVGSGLTRMNDDLILKVSGSDDQVTLTDWFKGGEHVVQQIDFASGGQITSSQLFQMFGMNDLTPSANADTASRSHARLFSAAQSMTQAMSAFGGSGDSGSNVSATLHNTAHQPWAYLTSSV